MLKNKIKLITSSLSLMLVMMVSFASFAPVAEALNQRQNLCGGAELKVAGRDCKEGSGTNLNRVIARIVNVISVIVGIVAVIMIIFGGFKYITSGGDSGNITSAKHTILYAIVGLIIVALAQVIVRFVIGKAT